MLVTELYNGQGLGNQLWCFTVTRAIALRNNYNFGIKSPEKFKGYKLFKNINFGKSVTEGSGPEGGPPTSLPATIDSYYKEKTTFHKKHNCDISKTDILLLNVKDNTKIDGTMQSEKYLEGYEEQVKNWLEIMNPIYTYSDKDNCIIHIRGGDFSFQTEVALSSDYYHNCIRYFKQLNPNMNFFIVTDDIQMAKMLLPGIQIIGSSLNTADEYKATHHIGGDISIDYAILNSARNIILSNSSFAWWATWTNKQEPTVLAPKYWARHNISDGFWSTGDILTKKWLYMGRDRNVYSYKYCVRELVDFEKNNPSMYTSI